MQRNVRGPVGHHQIQGMVPLLMYKHFSAGKEKLNLISCCGNAPFNNRKRLYLRIVNSQKIDYKLTCPDWWVMANCCLWLSEMGRNFIPCEKWSFWWYKEIILRFFFGYKIDISFLSTSSQPNWWLAHMWWWLSDGTIDQKYYISKHF